MYQNACSGTFLFAVFLSIPMVLLPHFAGGYWGLALKNFSGNLRERRMK